MDKELKELAQRAGLWVAGQLAGPGAKHVNVGHDEQLAEFAALIATRLAESCAVRRTLATVTLANNTFPDDERWTEGYAHGADSCEAAMLEAADRWRSVIPSTPQEEK